MGRASVTGPEPGERRKGRVLVAGMGNVLRGDDGFGVAVARELERRELPAGVQLIEVGIGGMHIVQELMAGYEFLVIVDAVDRSAEPGTIFVLEPDVPDAPDGPRERRELLADVHYTVPSRALFLAKALGRLPGTVRLVGCQPGETRELGMELSPSVRAAVARAVRKVQGMLEIWCPDAAGDDATRPASA